MSMAQFHVLLGTPWLIVYGLRKKAGAENRRWQTALWILLAVAVVLCLGSFSPLPVRMWLARGFKIFRMSRFLAAEYKLYALMILIYFAARAFEFLTIALGETGRRRLFALALLDILVILLIKRRFVLQEVDRAALAPMQVTYTSKEQKLYDQRRDCPADHRVKINNTVKDYFFAKRFSADGFSPMSIAQYVHDFPHMEWAICGEGRLFLAEGRQAVPYELISATPNGIKFKLKPPRQNAVYVWAETADPFWRLAINGVAHEFAPGPAHLRYFSLPYAFDDKDVTVEMTYRGPLTRFF
jgi:hypothetical protein